MPKNIISPIILLTIIETVRAIFAALRVDDGSCPQIWSLGHDIVWRAQEPVIVTENLVCWVERRLYKYSGRYRTHIMLFRLVPLNVQL